MHIDVAVLRSINASTPGQKSTLRLFPPEVFECLHTWVLAAFSTQINSKNGWREQEL
jgi:hypothetical protein